ncbi:MAG: Mut7-C RNAse domain-containing protein [Xanthomonadales bacterium]|nr:Mut7-C RNAse domain-containing protein [Xanthomonadales bacterium]
MTVASGDWNHHDAGVMTQPQASSIFRFYAELNDFLKRERRGREFDAVFANPSSVKDTIEALGVPHTEVDLVLVNGKPRRFDDLLRGGERVSVYPVFERLDISELNRLRPRPLRTLRFVLDVHLGQLARRLRLLGLDVVYRNDLGDEEIVQIALAQKRTILTRDKGILKHRVVDRGHWMRATDPDAQAREVIEAFDLRGSCAPFTRCLECNGILADADPGGVVDRVPEQVARDFHHFRECRDCRRVYWPGSHYDRLRQRVAGLLELPPG